MEFQEQLGHQFSPVSPQHGELKLVKRTSSNEGSNEGTGCNGKVFARWLDCVTVDETLHFSESQFALL